MFADRTHCDTITRLMSWLGEFWISPKAWARQKKPLGFSWCTKSWMQVGIILVVLKNIPMLSCIWKRLASILLPSVKGLWNCIWRPVCPVWVPTAQDRQRSWSELRRHHQDSWRLEYMIYKGVLTELCSE